MINEAILRRMWPRASSNKIRVVAGIADGLLTKYRITDDLTIAHFMAQISHENGGGTIVRENMNYRTAARIMEIFGVGKHSARVTLEEAQQLVGRPYELAERVYGLGNPKKAKEFNNVRPGDGYRYRGGGDLQLTGASNYKRIGEMTGFDLYEQPELLEDFATSFEIAICEFIKLKCVQPARADDIVTVTRRVNGGTNGLGERRVWLRKWKAILAEDDETKEDPAVRDLIATPVPLPPEPRGGESNPNPDNKGVVIARTVGGAIGGGGATVAAVNSIVGPVSETVEQVREVTTTAGNVVEVVTRVPSTFWGKAYLVMTHPLFLLLIIVSILAAWGLTWYLKSRQKEE